ncbi:MAG: DUF1993 domain-containing protein [Burkholderiales bacterium]|jgi:hypothetical protein|nr:DUF1993 domain-containing protein [Burkholderiales bacterium]
MLSMHAVSVPVYARMLTNLSAILDKAAAFAETKKIEPKVLLDMRLAPDMFPLTRQVQIACDFAKGSVARLAGQEPPKWEDNEASIADLKARIARTIEFLQGFQAADIDAGAQRQITLQVRGETKVVAAQPYLLTMAMPNFYFHVTTAYAILRHAGVDIGKRDFIGAI